MASTEFSCSSLWQWNTSGLSHFSDSLVTRRFPCLSSFAVAAWRRRAILRYRETSRELKEALFRSWTEERNGMHRHSELGGAPPEG